ncbi:DEHA2E04356p [Debaryomyces hansenii CBS767]|uniref:DEHA2E04356p n=1 Tax=Debaryomyces hansenii (strain ATCC 36239 / CBS 767 / BCRC 21394 / JCM 1990 / NBRC 0083 / IGC 2968) TaxID=284592 RepID=B5RTV0_DEBHA|nr:DEHA2E04356p [Debaryomyces hansenii CBS767]CAR65762.1 DEHA2E04356p [Debaryomyces hansenii CBS767]|eukprot:XP_002770416.1 DEHA2E04356p [Debaryomyces hansenii CBS767]
MSSPCRTPLTIGHRDSFVFPVLSGRSILHPFSPSALRHFCSSRPSPIPVRYKPLHRSCNYIVQIPQYRPTISVFIYYQPTN